MKMWMILMVFALLVSGVYSSQFFFYRILDCQDKHQSNKPCRNWTESCQLSYFAYSYCFPGQTYVQGVNGSILMSDLKIGDEILGLDRNTNLPVYSPVIAWLHRDTEVFFDYTIINTDSSSTFLASDLHNIATESNGKILFKFAQDLQPGQSLYVLGRSQLSVLGTAGTQQSQGMFAPLTASSTYFIHSNQFKQSNDDTPMILVHSLSKLKNPQSHISTVHTIVQTSHWFGHNIQPADNMIYTHLVYKYLHFLFNTDWISDPIKMNHRATYYSSSTNQQQKNTKKMKRTSMAVSILQVLNVFYLN